MADKNWGLKLIDFAKGSIMAIGTPVLLLLQELIPNYNIGVIPKAALAAFVTYLIKNYFTDDVKAAKKVLAKEEQDKTGAE